MMTKFNVGDKVRVTCTHEVVPYGTLLTVKHGPSGSGAGGNYRFNEIDGIILGWNLELIAKHVEQPKPTKNERITALETEVSALKAKVEALEKAVKYPLTARFDDETTAKADVILADIKRKATPQQKTQSPNQQRADVIKRAKAFAVKQQPLGGRKVKYVVNAEKRTVVALVYRVSFGFEIGIYARGIAKCDPSDVFNADIGKAIALGRALGVDVAEFTKAVQPTYANGQIITFPKEDAWYRLCNYRIDDVKSVVNNLTVVKSEMGSEGTKSCANLFRKGAGFNVLEILDDTDAVYE